MTRQLKRRTPNLSLSFFQFRVVLMKQYLHLSAYRCDLCAGPVIRGSLAVRENEISKETNIREIGAICLCCAQRHNNATEPALVRHFLLLEWEPAG